MVAIKDMRKINCKKNLQEHNRMSMSAKPVCGSIWIVNSLCELKISLSLVWIGDINKFIHGLL